jgi:hypothetical protein
MKTIKTILNWILFASAIGFLFTSIKLTFIPDTENFEAFRAHGEMEQMLWYFLYAFIIAIVGKILTHLKD